MKSFPNREIHLIHRPLGIPDADDFALVDTPIPEPAAGQILVRNLYFSVDPYMRGRMNEGKSYVAPFELNSPLDGGCVGRVIQSRNDAFEEGAYVLGMKGWREYFLSDGRDVQPIDPSLGPVESFLGVLGMPGLTAYVGLLDVGRPRAGDTVYVSAAAGAVGSVVGQIARIKECRVVGSAGSAKKVAWLKETAGITAAFNYKDNQDLTAELGRQCPDGIDIYFDNVGGPHLQAALENMKLHGRVVMCGMISQYNAVRPPAAPRNLFRVITNRLRIEGFIVRDHQDRVPAFQQDMSRWLSEGRIRWEETVHDGIETAVEAFLGLFSGDNLGKMLVRCESD